MSYKYLDLTGLSHFWDKIKAKFDSFSRNDLAILDSKEYSGIYGSANDQASASFYFGTIRPTNWYNMWKIRFKVYASVPNQNNYRQYSDVTFYGNQTEVTYKIENKMYSTSNRCYYYVNLCKLNATGYNAGYSYIPGINLRSSNNPTSSSYPRTFKIEILETENCTFTFYEAMKKVANIAEYNTTNYVGISEYDGANNGLRETGDDTNIWQLRHNSGNFVTSTALYRYMLCLQKTETTLVPINAVNNSTATNKTLTTETFNPFGSILYYNSTSTINASASVGAGTLFEQIALDLRYSFNTGTTLTAHKDVFMVAVPQSDGKAKLHSTPITQSLPTTEDGLIYIYLGRAYSNYQIELYPIHPIYEYKGGYLKLYINDITSNYSREIQSGTIDDLVNRIYGKTGMTGSISLTQKSSGTGSEIPAGWYNFFFAPHRNGMTWDSSDNGNYGTIILTPMNFSGKSWIIRRGYSNGSPVVSEVKSIATGDLANYVTLSTAQTISGNKTHSGTITMNNVNNINYSTSTTSNIIPSATGLANPPWNKDLWHDHFALLRYHTIESKEVTNDGTTWNTSSLDINSMFLGKDSASVTVLAAANLAFRFVLKNTSFAYSGVSWFELGVAYTSPFSSFEVLIEFSSDKSTWTTCHQSTITSNSSPFFLKNNTSFSSDGYIRVTFTKKTELTTGTVRVGCLKALCIRKGDQGLGSEYEYPYDWDINSNLLPIANNAKNLGDNNHKWANVYATTFNGNATSATKATGDKNGADITTTYYKASNPNGYTSNTGTITGIKMNGATMGTSGMVDLGSIYNVTGIPSDADLNNYKSIGAYYSNTHVQNAPQLATQGFYLLVCKATDNYILQEVTTTSMVKYIRRWNGTVWTNWQEMKYTDTTYSSKTAASGGTDVSLVTTGEKYTWNNKQNALSSQTAYSAKGSATKVPQITTNSLGQVTGITEVTITQPTVNNGTLTIQKNGTSVGTFTANQSGNSTANITVPTKTTDLANDSGFIESEDETVANIVSLTKEEYDALDTKTPNTLYNIIDDYEDDSITTGSGTINSTYINTTENNHYEKTGHVVAYSFTMTAKGTWGNTTPFVSGLPKPVRNTRFVGIDHSANKIMRFEIKTDGVIYNAYSAQTPSSGYTIEGHITYITSE